LREGKIEVRGGRVWYRTWGEGGATPLLVLHGGPGMSSDYLHNLSVLADEREVIVYDQLGCGRSDRPTDAGLFVAERFLEELAQVRDVLALDEVHMLGSSWGTALAVMYQSTSPNGVKSLTLQGAYLSTSRWEKDNETLLRAMPDIEKVIRSHRRAGFTSCPEYAAALYEVYRRHMCRLDPWPDDLHRSYEGSGDLVYRTMWGRDELVCDGNLKRLDVTAQAREIRVPTIIIVGEYDQCTPATAAFYQECIPGSELVVLEDASHLANLEKPNEFHAAVRAFIGRFD
jgi:proline iminopeptidase